MRNNVVLGQFVSRYCGMPIGLEWLYLQASISFQVAILRVFFDSFESFSHQHKLMVFIGIWVSSNYQDSSRYSALS